VVRNTPFRIIVVQR